MEINIDNIWITGKSLESSSLSEIPRKEIGYSIGMKLGDGKDSHQIFMQASIKLFHHPSKQKIGSIDVVVSFTLTVKGKVYEGKLNKLKNDVRNRLVEEVLGISRGVIFKEFAETPLKNALLPFVNGVDIMKHIEEEKGGVETPAKLARTVEAKPKKPLGVVERKRVEPLTSKKKSS